MKALIEKKNALLDEADALIHKAKTENRAFEDSELNRYNEIKAELARLNKTISAVKETREAEIDEPDNKRTVQKKPKQDFLKPISVIRRLLKLVPILISLSVLMVRLYQQALKIRLLIR